jgi:hypothetical protein
MTDVEDRAPETVHQGDGTRLNHVEFLHRPGESSQVVELFESINCQCEQIDSPPYGKYIVVHMDSEFGRNDFFASEAEEEQLALEGAMQRQIDAPGSDLAAGYAEYRRMLEQRPYRGSHIGIRLPSVAVYDEVVQRLEGLSAGKFAGRLTVGDSISRLAEEPQPGLPRKQVWVWTDLISTGLLSIGQQIEVQTYGA